MLGLSRKGWSLTILTRWADPRLLERERVSPKIKIIRLRIGEVAPIDKRRLNDLHPTSLAAARSALAAPAVNLLHSVYWNSGRVAMDLSDELGIPFVHTVISNGWRRWQQGARDQPRERLEVERRVFTSAFAVFCVSRQERADLVEHYAIDPGKVVVVGRPVAYSFLHPCRDELGRPSRPDWREAGS
jgi:D-inositol-3-phosphate glycosyltransferase